MISHWNRPTVPSTPPPLTECNGANNSTRTQTHTHTHTGKKKNPRPSGPQARRGSYSKLCPNLDTSNYVSSMLPRAMSCLPRRPSPPRFPSQKTGSNRETLRTCSITRTPCLPRFPTKKAYKTLGCCLKKKKNSRSPGSQARRCTSSNLCPNPHTP